MTKSHPRFTDEGEIVARTTTSTSPTVSTAEDIHVPLINGTVDGKAAYIVLPSGSLHTDPNSEMMGEDCGDPGCRYCYDYARINYKPLERHPYDSSDYWDDDFWGSSDYDYVPLSYYEPQDWDEYVLGEEAEVRDQADTAWAEYRKARVNERKAALKKGAEDVLDYRYQPPAATKPKHRTNRERGRRPQQAKPRMTTPEHRRRDLTVKWRDSGFDQHTLAEKRVLDSRAERLKDGPGWTTITTILEEEAVVIPTGHESDPLMWGLEISHFEEVSYRRGLRPAGSHKWAQESKYNHRDVYRRRSSRSRRQRNLRWLDWDSQESIFDLRREAEEEESEEVFRNIYGDSGVEYRRYVDELLYRYGSTETPGYTRPSYSRLSTSMPMAA